MARKGWYRGEHSNTYPYAEDLSDVNAMVEFFLKGWLPEEPWMTQEMRVTALGSCFAGHMIQALTDQGFGGGSIRESHIFRCGDSLVNTYALWQQFAWAWEEVFPKENTWYDWEGNLVDSGEEVRVATKKIFDSTDVFIFTFGLSEVWCNKVTGEIFWRAIREKQFDPEVHGFRVLSAGENQKNITAIWNLIKKHRPNAKVIFTLSPVPLFTTFRSIGCYVANEVSKSSLRAAIDQFLFEHQDKDLFYWPSYEIVRGWKWGKSPFEKDNRHPRLDVIKLITDSFIKYHCQGQA